MREAFERSVLSAFYNRLTRRTNDLQDAEVRTREAEDMFAQQFVRFQVGWVQSTGKSLLRVLRAGCHGTRAAKFPMLAADPRSKACVNFARSIVFMQTYS